MKNRFLLTALLGIMCSLFSMSMTFAATEVEPNDSELTAQEVVLGETYDGALAVNEIQDNYKIPVVAGKTYKITINGCEPANPAHNTPLIHLKKDSAMLSASDINSTVFIGGSANNSVENLFKANYTGYYILNIDNNNAGALYSFKVEECSVIGKTIKDDKGNVYKIISSESAELIKLANKNEKSLYVSNTLFAGDIEGAKCLRSSDFKYVVTTIGKNLCKGSKVQYVTLGDFVSRIKSGAFMNCKKLGAKKYSTGLYAYGKKLVIDSNAFKGCKGLSRMVFSKKGSIKKVGKNAFKGTKKRIKVVVPNIKKAKKLFKKAGLKRPAYFKTVI